MLRPTAVDDAGFTVEAATDGDGFVVRGSKPERWVQQTDFGNDEAVGYLADRLARLGVEKALAAAGAEPGCQVTIGDVSFDWQPTELEQFASGLRGQDVRLEVDQRIGADRRRELKDIRRAERLGLDHLLDDPSRPRTRPARTARGEPRRPSPRPAGSSSRSARSSLTTADGGSTTARLDALVDALAARDGEVVLVSSGAIAAGLAPLGLARRPRDLATLQAAASVGQSLLVQRYATAFARHGRTVGQVLLTADDVVRRSHYRNAQTTLERLLALGVVPVVNENDAVATEEIRFGDNDRLAALVAHLVRADALVLLSDVDGLYDGDPRRAGRAAARRGRAGRRTWRRVDVGGAGSARRHRRDGQQGRRGPGRDQRRRPGAADAARTGSRRRCAARAARCSPPPAAAAAAGCSGSSTPAPPAAGCVLDAGAVAAVVRPAAVAAAGRGHGASRASSGRATRSSWSGPDGTRRRPRARRLRRRRAARAARPLDPRARAARGRPPRRPGGAAGLEAGRRTA